MPPPPWDGALLFGGPADAAMTVVLAHGAGQPSDSPFMAAMAEGLAAAGLRVVRFDFPYMRARRETGGRRPPDRAPVLLATWHGVIESLGGGGRLAIGGKSMGGRMASMIADAAGARGLVCLGYPFHPPGRPEKTRTAHLQAIQTPTLIVQGTRDPFGGPEDVGAYALSDRIRTAWIEDGDHSLRPRKESGRTPEGNLAEAVALVAAFVGRL